ncbi:hypothetical protein [Geothrix sp. 21YS21S-4]|uniref:hypothetical protein n=1 Tax=Geothrix sp. 21YS21S-4 TaxID=3068889 RepID=UPI0027BA7F5F|nr:hypothetical protein [Geothrix sp. 21YS21S-4]
MPISLQPPPQPPALIGPESVVELPMYPGSDPMILATYRWVLAHSPSLREVVRRLARADKKARFRLVPGLGDRYDFLITPTPVDYEIEIQVPILGWTRCEDALEPWIASSLFLALEVVEKERYRDRSARGYLAFLDGSLHGSFVFQRKVRQELQAVEAERLKDLPDGPGLYRSGFRPSPQWNRQRRALPDGVPLSAEK